MKVFTNRSFYCDFCKIGYNHRIEHKCKNLCKMCNRVSCDVSQKIKCEFCNIFCNQKKCLDLHQTKVCKSTRICEKVLNQNQETTFVKIKNIAKIV